MNMWLQYSNRPGTCDKCFEPYAKDEAVGVIRVPDNSGIGSRRVIAHPRCWLHIGLDALQTLPLTRPVRGRRPTTLNDEEHEERKKILAKYGAYAQRIRILRDDMEYLKEHNSDAVAEAKIRLYGSKIARLEMLQDMCCIEVRELGGIPRSWMREKEVA